MINIFLLLYDVIEIEIIDFIQNSWLLKSRDSIRSTMIKEIKKKKSIG